ncbi:MAG TPA: YncE family protein [Phenylobacterium sp.]|nr:YncE family protein [Phenylobacterium sp.]
MRLSIIGAVAGLACGAAGAAFAAAPGYHVLDKIPGPDGGWDYARVDAKTDRVYVTRGSAVEAIDLATRKVTTGLVPGGREHIALPVNGGAEILVTDGGANTAIFADAVTGAPAATVPTGKGPDSATLDPHSGLVLVMDHAGGEVTLVDPKTRKVVGTIPVGGTLEEGAVDGAGHAFIAVEDKHEIAAVDIAGRKVTARWPLPGCDGPSGLAYDNHDKLLIAACDGASAVISTADGKVQAMLPTGKGADGAVYDPARRLAFVPAGRDGTLSVIGFAKGHASIVETVPTQKGARTIALDERSGRLYLPSATYVVQTTSGRPTPVAGTFQVIVVGK